MIIIFINMCGGGKGDEKRGVRREKDETRGRERRKRKKKGRKEKKTQRKKGGEKPKNPVAPVRRTTLCEEGREGGEGKEEKLEGKGIEKKIKEFLFIKWYIFEFLQLMFEYYTDILFLLCVYISVGNGYLSIIF